LYHQVLPKTQRLRLEATSKAAVYNGQQWSRVSVPFKGSEEWFYFFVVLICFTGHEDLRQDERVMQLFGLVNTLLAVDKESFMRDLHIQRYAVIPLAANVGLLRWVGNSDTLHVLIRDYRDSKKILLNIEYRLMLQAGITYSAE
jgi:FKBP12-rapamycin complex-associated protein